MDLLLTGRIIRGHEGAEMACSPGPCRPATCWLRRWTARDIAVNVAAVSAALVKRLVYLGAEMGDREAHHALENKAFGFAARSADTREGHVAFLDKRDPRWKLQKNADFPGEIFGG